MKRYKLYLLTLLFAGLTTSSCKDSYLTEQPLNIIAPDNLYVNKAGFEAGLYGLYGLVRRERAGIGSTSSGSIDLSNDLASTAAMVGVDNAFSLFPASGAPEQVFNEFGILLNSTNPYVRSVWEWLYQVINAANTIIDRSGNPAINWSATEKAQIVGEARLIRAWAYRHLTFLYGDVPLNIRESTGATIRTDWERTPVADVRKQMEADLLFAETNMAELAPLEGRMPRAVATHYLAELYLTTGDNASAKAKAQSLISNPLYKLVTARYGVRKALPGTAFTDMFIDGNTNRSQGNTEALWVVQNEYLSAGGENNILRRWWVNRYDRISVGGKTPVTFSVDNGGRGIGRFGITRFGLSLYGTGDERGSYHALRLFWLMNNAASLPTGAKLGDTVRTAQTGLESLNNQNWPNTRKWDWAPAVAEDVQQSSTYNDQMYLRLGETYLLLAEAQLKLGETDNAAVTINTLRTRAKAKLITAADLSLDFILDERSRELITEEHRRYTLIRTGKWLERTKKYNALAGNKITERDQLLPIPQSVIDANLTRKMAQNPGY
ncbi:RagB/SusD family nutrient uptake outer membrane protein [Spirosoma fluviale]|uniref:Starch-binding associating with outer membrane n=1 Tax=Spirosoma fluviale TaxID=1597977 RepID=A0A286FZQ1_9BACT|nr:RagB/SusD family nutrient uptake outer membrane protein [Spirosoma fluviale]SOD88735.1 Starch-binding associating with outer membrane [Spirosoma fluviale]